MSKIAGSSSITTLGPRSYNGDDINIEPKLQLVDTGPHDIVELAVLRHRRNTFEPLIPNYDDPIDTTQWEQFTSHLTEEDRSKAAQIKEFYLHKMTAATLTSSTSDLSEYRKKLLKLLTKRENLYTRHDVKVAYRLPEFYEYDTQLISHVFNEDTSLLAKGSKTINGTKRLHFIRKLYRKTKYYESFDYWFRNDKHNRILLQVRPNNNLIDLFECIIQQGPIDVTGLFIPRSREASQTFYRASNWKIQTESLINHLTKGL